MLSMIRGIIWERRVSGSILVNWMCSHRRISLKRFLTWDSVRPSMILAISLHLFPSLSHCSRNSWSSFRVNWFFLMDGSSAVSHRSQHCFQFLAVIIIFSFLLLVRWLSNPLGLRWAFQRSRSTLWLHTGLSFIWEIHLPSLSIGFVASLFLYE